MCRIQFKSLLTCIIIMIFSVVAKAQRIDYNTIILPANAKDISFEEKLVRLAWENSPNNNILNSQVSMTKYDVKLANRFWLNQITASGNINEFTINPPSNLTYPLFYPRYNFSAAISLGNLFSDPLRARRAKEEVKIATENINAEKLKIRAEVLRRYQTYLTAMELLKIQAEISSDALDSYNLAKVNFEKSAISLEQYNLIVENRNTQASKRIIAQSNVNIAIIDIEEMIGVKLEDVH